MAYVPVPKDLSKVKTKVAFNLTKRQIVCCLLYTSCPIRPIEQNGKWGCKQHRVYELDEDGNRIRDADGNFVFNAVPTTDWGSPETLGCKSFQANVG